MFDLKALFSHTLSKLALFGAAVSTGMRFFAEISLMQSRFLLAGVAALCLSGGQATAERLQAAVIGNSSYQVAPLANAARDAATVAEALANVGFEVSTYFDVAREDIDSVLAEISEQFKTADISLLYYAGHAFQFDGKNQLLATDISELTREEIEAKSFSLSDVLAATRSDEVGVGMSLILVDACRDDPFSNLDEAISRGLAFEESGSAETLIAYSTSAGELAYDGPAGGNGPYALALTRALQNDKPTVASVLRTIRRDVRVATGGLQIPWVVGSIETDPVLSTEDQAEDLVLAAEGEVPPLDSIVWRFVRKDLTEDTLAQFILNFPNSPFAPEADERVRQIRANREGDSRGIEIIGAASSSTLNELAEARQQIDADFEFRPDTTLPSELFRIWPRELPVSGSGLSSIVTRCDVLASDPADPQRIAPPIRGGLVNLREAARACGFALARDPDNPRLLFQFGRVLQIAGRYDWARLYYLRASREYSAALTNLGFMAIEGIGQDKNYEAAAEFYRQAAEMGNLRARTNLGTMYIRGEGLPELPEEGILWYRLAAGMGWANAQNALADLYRKGVSIEKDEQASAALYHLAASNGQRAAMNNLGVSYLKGLGVTQDETTAVLWFDRAIQEGDRFAPRNLARHLMDASNDQIDGDRVVSLLEMATNRGERRAYLDLAHIYRKGDLVERDLGKAYLNARLAQLRKVSKADDLVLKLKEKLSDASVDEVETEIKRRQRLNGI
jgi:TPR repeat protein